MWLKQVFISFFYVIDRTLFNFIPTVYDFIMMLSRTSVLTQGQIKDFAGRIQMLLGVFMLFKVAFSIITYIVNPDEFGDKSKGFAKLWQNAIISLILLVLTPYAFNMAYEFQKMVLEENAIGNLILGEEIGKNKLVNAGQEMAYSVMIPFFSPNVSIQDLNSCVSLTEDVNGNRKFTSECRTNMYKVKDKDPDKPEFVLENYVLGVENKSVGLTFRLDIAKETVKVNGDEQFLIDYNFPISTAVAIVVLLLLVTYCMDIALRSVKLAFLQLISPIPIISYIDPKSGKDGMFSKWYKMCFSTYISLFVRLAVLYFGVYIISMLDGNAYDIVNGSTINDRLINVVIIIGVLMFIKQFPKILEGLGIKLDGAGKFHLNPFKKFEEEAFGGKQILGAGAAMGAGALAGGVNVATRIPRFLNAGRNLFRKATWLNEDGSLSFGSVMRGAGRSVHGMLAPVRSGIGGAFGGTFRGFSKTVRGEKAGKIFTDSLGEAMFAKIQREDLNRKGSTWIGRRLSDINRWTGTLDAAQMQTLEYGEIENAHKDALEGIKSEKEALDREKQGRLRTHNENYNALSRINERINGLKNSHANVKDADEYVENLKRNNEYYVKLGEMFHDENGVLRAANSADVANRVLSDVGRLADEKLKHERREAYVYLKNHDAEVQTHIHNLQENGITENDFIQNNEFNKAFMYDVKNSIDAVNAEYYSREQALSERERVENDYFIAEVERRGLDKSSREWKANEADHAAAPTKGRQPDNFMPSPDTTGASRAYDPRYIGGFNGNRNGGPPTPPPGGTP